LIVGGVITVTQEGRAGNGPWRRPNRFRLTYRSASGKPSTNEWKNGQATVETRKLDNFRPHPKTILSPHPEMGCGTIPQNDTTGIQNYRPPKRGYSLESSPSRRGAPHQGARQGKERVSTPTPSALRRGRI
jgi:hypothetical protein